MELESEFKCPKCDGKMMRIAAVSEPVWRCGGCSGLWMSLPTRERLLEQADKVQVLDEVSAFTKKVGDQKAASFGICPDCSGAMIQMVDADQPHIEFEQCATCGGVYLDAGELADLSTLKLTERVRAIWQTRISR